MTDGEATAGEDRSGDPGPSSIPPGYVVVHGAGSFGHIQVGYSYWSAAPLVVADERRPSGFAAAQAKKFKLTAGDLVGSDEVRWGFADCRRSVTRLNHIMVTCLVGELAVPPAPALLPWASPAAVSTMQTAMYLRLA